MYVADFRQVRQHAGIKYLRVAGSRIGESRLGKQRLRKHSLQRAAHQQYLVFRVDAVCWRQTNASLEMFWVVFDAVVAALRFEPQDGWRHRVPVPSVSLHELARAAQTP